MKLSHIYGLQMHMQTLYFFKIIKACVWGEKKEIRCLSFSYCYGCDIRTTEDLALLG